MEEKDIVEKLKRAKLPVFPLEKTTLAAKQRFLSEAEDAKKPKLHPVLRVLAAAAVLTAFATTTFYMVDNMDDGSRINRDGGIWSTYSDYYQGGSSIVWPPEKEGPGSGFFMSKPGFGEKGWAVRVTGRAGDKLGENYSYLGVVMRLKASSACPRCEGTDISRYRGLRFRLKGELKGGTLRFILPYETNECDAERTTCKSMTNYADYEKDITEFAGDEWVQVVINFREDLRQPSWAGRKYSYDIQEVLKNMHLFKWQYTGPGGSEADFWIDDLELF
ncbi:MAG TPA: hypothetical protein ENN55_05210 [Firmicutes bacterium]|nr:hypothetical protein [Bacillota bacterium]